jgi:hypothetical protein
VLGDAAVIDAVIDAGGQDGEVTVVVQRAGVTGAAKACGR